MKAGEKVCAECGLEEVVWRGNDGEGYLLEGQWYCCQDCAEGMDCACHAAQQPRTIRDTE